MFRSFGKLTFVLAMASATRPESDELDLLQVAMTAKVKQLKPTEVEAYNGPEQECKDIPNALLVGEGECSFTKMKSIKTEHEAIETATEASDFDLTTSESASDFVEAIGSMPSVDQESITAVLHYLFNMITFAVCVDVLRRLSVEVSNLSSEKELSEVVDDFEALHKAAKDSSVPLVERLLARGSSVNAADDWEETALHHAARAGAIDVCELLISHEACTDAKNMQGWTPLVAAASAGKRAMCQWLLGRGATHGDLEESMLPPMLQALMKPEMEEPDDLPAQVESEADLIRRILEPKPEWEEPECMPDWELDTDDDFVPTVAE